MTTFEQLLLSAPAGTIPPADSPAYKLLRLFVDQRASSKNTALWRDQLSVQSSGAFRAYLQQLTGDMFGFWLIQSEESVYKGIRQARYWLDERHLKANWQDDSDARLLARKRYKNRSYKCAVSGVKRIEKAAYEKARADIEYELKFRGQEQKSTPNTISKTTEAI